MIAGMTSTARDLIFMFFPVHWTWRTRSDAKASRRSRVAPRRTALQIAYRRLRRCLCPVSSSWTGRSTRGPSQESPGDAQQLDETASPAVGALSEQVGFDRLLRQT